MGNPAVMVCFDCKEYFEVGIVGEEEWAAKHMTHETSIVPENLVSGWFSEFKNAAVKKRSEAERQKGGGMITEKDLERVRPLREGFKIERFRCESCGIFIKKPAGIPPGKDFVVACTRGHSNTYHSPAIWFVQGFRDPLTGIEGDDVNTGLSIMEPLKTISEALKRCASPDIISVHRSEGER